MIGGGPSAAELLGLSPAERDVLEFAMLGYSRGEYLATRKINANTHKSRVKGLLRKCGAKSVRHACLLVRSGRFRETMEVDPRRRQPRRKRRLEAAS